MDHRPVIVGLGEVLWDRFPEADRLGGAPANFAFHAAQLGARARIVSRIGRDPDGARLGQALADQDVSRDHLQIDPVHPTGTVLIQLRDGQPAYEIPAPAAWDFLEWTPDLEQLAAQADAVSFGTLAQRNPVSRATIRQFVRSTPATALRLFDINLRQSFYSREVIEFGLAHATVVKLNGDELGVVARLFNWPADAGALAARAREIFGVRGIALTLGAGGCELYFEGAAVRSVPPPIECRDAVGAGDAFSAALILGLLGGEPLQSVADRANEVGAFVASQSGAMPRLPEALSMILAK